MIKLLALVAFIAMLAAGGFYVQSQSSRISQLEQELERAKDDAVAFALRSDNLSEICKLYEEVNELSVEEIRDRGRRWIVPGDEE